MEFTPINTQEEFDARVAELYGDVAGLQQQVTDLTGERDGHATTIADLQNQIKGYETADLKRRIAREKGLPYEMADRLAGESEQDIRADADTLVGTLRAVKGAAPLFNPDPPIDDKNASMTAMLHELRGE